MPTREDTRQAHQDALDALIAPVEALVARELRRLLTAITEDVFAFAAMTAAGEPIDLNALSGITNQWAGVVQGKILPAVQEVHATGAISVMLPNSQVSEATARRIAQTIPDVLPIEASTYLQGAGNRITAIGDRSWVTLRDELVRGMEAGDSIPNLQRRVRSAINVSETHARTIARTEVIGATNAGSLTGAHLLGDDAPRFKEWLATSDGRTRPSHAEADGQTVLLDEPFSVGGVSMQRPHDPGAPAREVANCRCTLTYTDDPPDGWQDEPAETTLSPAPPTQAVGALSADDYDIMRPTSSWSAERREAILARLRASPNGRILADTLDKFQDGGSIARLRTNIEKRLAGTVIDPTSTARADAVIDAIRHAPDNAPAVMYRGMSVSGTEANLLAKYQGTSTLDLNLTSFTSDRNVAKRFQMMTAKKGSTRVMVELVGPDKRLIPIQNLARDRRLFKEKEWVGGGSYDIVEAKRSPAGGIILRVVQRSPL